MIRLPRENVGGFMVDTQPISEIVADMVKAISQPDSARPQWAACLNPHSFAESLKDEIFARSLRDADWLVPDGSGVVLASRFLGGSIRGRVTGSDIFSAVSLAMNERGGATIFFLGSTEQTLAEIKKRIEIDFPKLRVVGTYSPPFKASYSGAELNDMVTAVNAASPDILWVGMTAPKQEKWLYQQRNQLEVKFAAAIGAVFDYYTGSVKRAHPVVQQMHLEWLPRLLQQPGRLWRRMIISAPVFVWYVLRQRSGARKKSSRENA